MTAVKAGTAKVNVIIKKGNKIEKLVYKAIVKKPEISSKDIVLDIGKKTKLTVKNKPKKAQYTWSSENSDIATVSKNGTVMAVGKGLTNIVLKVKTNANTYLLSSKVTINEQKDDQSDSNHQNDNQDENNSSGGETSGGTSGGGSQTGDIENPDEIDYNKDTDKDGIPDYDEELIHTDPNKADTDDDGLNDYLERYLLYDPLTKNPESNDYDGDNLTDLEEIKLGTDLKNSDTDGDGLNDGEEKNTYNTDPMKSDTDEDTILDGEGIRFGLDPNKKDDINQPISETFNAKQLVNDYDENVYPEMELTGSVKSLENFRIETREADSIINSSIPGYIGNAYEFSTSENFDSAKVTFHVDQELFQNENFDPQIYYYNEESQLLEKLENQSVDREKGTVSASLQHFSTYIVLDGKEFSEAWNENIGYFTDDQKKNGIDYAFVIDTSGSMSSNDRNGLRLSLSQKMTNKMGDQDRAMVVTFSTDAKLLQPLTTDKNLINTALGNKRSSGSTAMLRGIHTANQEYRSSSDSSHSQIMVLISDGHNNISGGLNINTVIQEAKDNHTKIFTIGLGSNIDEDLLKEIASETGGKYFYASVADDLDEVYSDIGDETVDYDKDSNNDGISDYHTKLLCEGKLTTGTGKAIFAGIPYETVQSNDDYDGDGLKNGEEVTVTRSGKTVYLKMISNPTTKFSDADPYDDKEETIDLRTDSLVDNGYMYQNDIDGLNNNSLYQSSIYEEKYNDSKFEQGTTWVGNYIFGSNYDYQEIDKDMLVDYFASMNEEACEYCEYLNVSSMVQSYIYQLDLQMDNARGILVKRGENIDALLDLQKQIEHSRKAMADLVKSSSVFSKEEFYKQVDSIQESINTATSKSEALKNVLKTQEVPVKNKLIIFSNGKSSEKVVKVVGNVSNVLQVANGISNGVKDFLEYKSNLEVIQDNIYVLETVAANADDDNLKEAAESLLFIMRNKYNQAIYAITDVSIEATEEVINIALHTAIAAIPVVGVWIEIGISLASILIPISDMSKYHIRICGASCLSRCMGENLLSNLSRYSLHSTANGSQIYEIPSENMPDMVRYYINLIDARIFAEKDMSDLVGMRPQWLKWYYTLIGKDGDSILSGCTETVNNLKLKRYKYSI